MNCVSSTEHIFGLRVSCHWMVPTKRQESREYLAPSIQLEDLTLGINMRKSKCRLDLGLFRPLPNTSDMRGTETTGISVSISSGVKGAFPRSWLGSVAVDQCQSFSQNRCRECLHNSVDSTPLGICDHATPYPDCFHRNRPVRNSRFWGAVSGYQRSRISDVSMTDRSWKLNGRTKHL